MHHFMTGTMLVAAMALLGACAEPAAPFPGDSTRSSHDRPGAKPPPPILDSVRIPPMPPILPPIREGVPLEAP